MTRLATAAMAVAVSVLGSRFALGASTPSPDRFAALNTVVAGPIEQVPTSWGGGVMSPPAEMSTQTPAPPTQPLAPIAPLVMPSAPLVQEAALTPSSTPPAADQVTGLVVKARSVRPQDQTVEKCLTGPAWWRVSSPSATLWIIATPDRMPMDTRWDDTCLRKRLEAARVVIVPALPRSGAADPFSRGTTPLRIAETPLNQRVAADLWAQLGRRIDGNVVRAADERDWARSAFVDDLPPGVVTDLIPPVDNGIGADWGIYTRYRNSARTTLQVIRDTPNLFAPPVLVAKRLSWAFDPPGKLGNPAAARAVDLAGRANMLIGRTEISAAQFSDLTYLSDPAQADQEACLKKVIDELDAGHGGEGILDQVQAWAVGDVERGLKRLNVLSTCTFGDLSVRFWSSVVAQEMQLIDRTMNQGGVAVAVIEYDPLFMRGGVMERLQAAGYRVETPEELR